MRQLIMLLFMLLHPCASYDATQFQARYSLNKHGHVTLLDLPEKLEPGQTMTFDLVSNCNDPSIHLQSSGAKATPFIIVIRFAQRLIEMNSYAKLVWGTPQIVRPHSLQIGQRFELAIACHDDHFEILIDGKHIADYEYRQPLSFITHIEVEAYHYSHLYSYQLGKNKTAYPTVTGGINDFAVCKSTTPKDECKSLFVSGIVSVEWFRTYINIYRKNGDLSLHFNPRYDENRVCMGTLSSNSWWNMHYREMQLIPKVGERMEVEFENGEKSFKISVNGVYYFDFPHGLPSNDIIGVEVGNLREPVVVVR